MVTVVLITISRPGPDTHSVLTSRAEGRVAPTHCCVGAPSEPGVRLSPHRAQAGLKESRVCSCTGPGVVEGKRPRSAPRMYETKGDGIVLLSRFPLACT